MRKESLSEGQLWLHKKNRERLRVKHPLLYLFWESTLNCNFYCDHCGSSAGRKNYNNELTSEEIISVFRNISEKYNPKKITIAVTGGEPLLRNDLPRIMAEAKKLGFNWGLVTNGFLLTKKKINELKEAGMSTVTVSIDGIGTTHDNLRKKPGSYKKAIEGIELLAKADFIEHIQITTTINKINVNELDKMYEEFSKLPIQSWRVMNVDPIGRAELNEKLLLDKESFKKLICFIAEKRKKKGLKVTYDCSGYLGMYEGKVRDNYFYCLTGICVASILHDGDIFVCPNVPRNKVLIQGNIRKDNFVDIWENKYQTFRDKNRTKCKKCSDCNNWDECLGNGYHLWDQEKKETRLCHLEMLDLK